MKIKHTFYSFLCNLTNPIRKKVSFFRRPVAWLRLKKSEAFLQSYSCASWSQYNKEYDTDIIRYATLVSQFYHGYTYIHPIESSKSLEDQYGDWLIGLSEMGKWCEHNLSEKFRYDIHRVIRERGLIHNEYDDTMLWTEIDDYSMNDLGGQDVLFFAFKSKKDYTWFKLKWS